MKKNLKEITENDIKSAKGQTQPGEEAASLKYIYGPVYSWRLGVSLGIDPLTEKEKVCNYDCIYCQLGKTKHYLNERKVFVKTEKIVDEIKKLKDVPVDYLTFSGRGEPTLAKNLGEMIRALRKIRKEKIAVITNASLIGQKDVRRELALADFVLAKMDAISQQSLNLVDQPSPSVEYNKIRDGLTVFRKEFKGKLALQIMFMEQNKDFAGVLARIAKEIAPDEVQLNTPVRASAVQPLSPQEMNRLKDYFAGQRVLCVYDIEAKEYQPFNKGKTKLRHGAIIT